MKDGKPTGGYDRLKIKYEELQRELAEERMKPSIDDLVEEKHGDLLSTIEQQGKQIDNLTKEVNTARSDAQEYKRQRDEAIRHMGWLRRFWYGFSLPEFEENEHWRD